MEEFNDQPPVVVSLCGDRGRCDHHHNNLLYKTAKGMQVGDSEQGTKMLRNTTNAPDLSMCAACGKGSDGLKTCTACKLVKYCNATCQKAHRPMHKRECKKQAAKLHDEALFKTPPPRDECPICTLPLPINLKEISYQACCGKTLCAGCIDATFKADDRQLCPFCRTPEAGTDGEYVERLKKRLASDDADAITQLGCYYYNGRMGLPQNYRKANKLYLRAGELGCALAYHNLAISYGQGRGVERDDKKAKYYLELAAIGGYVKARHDLGDLERVLCNMNRALDDFGGGWR